MIENFNCYLANPAFLRYESNRDWERVTAIPLHSCFANNLQEIRFESYHGACFWCSFNAFIFRIVVLQRPEIKTSSSQHNLTVIKVMMTMMIKMVMIMKINMIIDHDDHHWMHILIGDYVGMHSRKNRIIAVEWKMGKAWKHLKIRKTSSFFINQVLNLFFSRSHAR